MKPYVDDRDFVLLHGDAREVLPQIDVDADVNCIVTSPPYYLLRDYEHDGQIGLEETLDDYLDALVAVFRECRRILRDDGVFWLNIGDTHSSAPRGPRHSKTSRLSTPDRQEKVSTKVDKRGRARGVKPKDLFAVPFELALALRADGWFLRQTVIWDKTNPIPESAKDRPTTSHEYVFLFAKASRYWYDGAAIAEPATWERWGNQSMQKDVVGKARLAKRMTKEELARKFPGISRGTRDARSAAIDGNDQPAMQPGMMKNARSVWRGNCAQFDGDHAAVMPDWLAERCILAGCPEGGVVLDPFAGAGTTALAARKLGRRSIGIEVSESSCAIAADRLRQQSLLTEGVA